MKYTEVSLRASVECEFSLGFAQVKDDSKVKCYRALARALVARNFLVALPLEKGTVK